MVYILLEGHDIKYDLVELLRIIFYGKEILYIDSINEYPGKGILVINILYEEKGKTYAKTELYIDNVLIKSFIENINEISVYRDSIEKDMKVAIKKTLIDALVETTNTKLPWGILTGIRPVKIPHDMIDKNINEEEIKNVLVNEYRLDLNKSNLILEIAKSQRKHIYPLNKDRYSLYISIPFCPTRCLYCSFPSLPIDKYNEYVKEYTMKLIYEIDRISELMEGKEINTVYIGGGTPTAIPPRELEKIIQNIYLRFGENNIKEFTVEAGRPDALTKEYLKMLSENNINRISINPQTMNDKTLKLIGRNHTSEDIMRTFHLAKEMNFKSINMDLIIGLPGETIKELHETLHKIKSLNPENLTIHTLSVKRGSRFKDTMGEYELQNQNTIREMLDETTKFAEGMELIPYYLYRQKQTLGNFENVGYGKLGMECIYNIAMMEEKETILGMGMGSVSKIFSPHRNKIERVPNFKGLKDYMTRIDELVENKKKALKNL